MAGKNRKIARGTRRSRRSSKSSKRSTTSKRLANLKRSLERAKKRNQKYVKERKALRTRTRDLEKSKNKWKNKAINAQQKLDNELAKNKLLNIPNYNTSVLGSSFCLLTIILGVMLFLTCTFSLRATTKAIALFYETLALPLVAPCPTTLSNWICKIGLQALNNPKIDRNGTNILIADCTRTYQGSKLLIVCLANLNDLKNRLDNKTGDYNLMTQDVTVIIVQPLETCNGEILKDIYQLCCERFGIPDWIITDRGSDQLKGLRLLINSMPINYGYKKIRTVSDISHTIARIIERTFRFDKSWKGFLSFIGSIRTKTAHQFRFFSPPSERQGPDRWMNLTGMTKWFGRLKKLLNDIFDNKLPEESSNQFGLSQKVFDRFKKYLGDNSHIMKDLIGQVFKTKACYEQAIIDKVPNINERIKNILIRHSDLKINTLKELTQGWKKHYFIHQEMIDTLDFVNEIQEVVKGKGFSYKTFAECEEIYKNSTLRGIKAKKVATDVIEELRKIKEEIEEDEVIVITSDVIESLHGKLNSRLEKSPTPALTHNVLMTPLLGKLTPEMIREGIESVRLKEVSAWLKENITCPFYKNKP